MIVVGWFVMESGLKRACNTVIRRWTCLVLTPAFASLRTNASQLSALRNVATKGLSLLELVIFALTVS